MVFHNLQPLNVWEQINEANMQKISGKFHYGPISTKLFLQQSSKMSGLVMTVEDLKGGGCKFSIQGSRQSGKLELTFFGSEIMGSQVVAAILSNKKPVLLLFLLFFSISTNKDHKPIQLYPKASTKVSNVLPLVADFSKVKGLQDAKEAKNRELIEIDLR